MKFHAVTVEAYLGEFDIHTVHFDDGGRTYLQLRTPERPHDPRDLELGYGLVEVEVNDQFYGGCNCFSGAELKRNRFRLFLARDKAMVQEFGDEVMVTFDVEDTAFEELKRVVSRVFRDFAGFRADES